MTHLHWRRRTPATLYYAEIVHIARTETRIPTPLFLCRTGIGVVSVPEFFSGNVNEPWRGNCFSDQRSLSLKVILCSFSCDVNIFSSTLQVFNEDFEGTSHGDSLVLEEFPVFSVWSRLLHYSRMFIRFDKHMSRTIISKGLDTLSRQRQRCDDTSVILLSMKKNNGVSPTCGCNPLWWDFIVLLESNIASVITALTPTLSVSGH